MPKRHTAWRTFLERIQQARKELGFEAGWSDSKQRECYYRGQGDSWPLLPSLHRALRKKHNAIKFKKLRKLEYDLYYEFKARAREVHAPSLDSWDILFTMQHYRAPTRLLDWTESFAVALYFALDGCRRRNRTAPCIWLLNPCQMNNECRGVKEPIGPKYYGYDAEEDYYYSYEEILIEGGTMDTDLPCALYPDFKNDRIAAQRGSFTIHGDDLLALDEQLPVDTGKIIRRVNIPNSAICDAWSFLSQAGVTHDSLFPDLEGLSQALRYKYGIDA